MQTIILLHPPSYSGRQPKLQREKKIKTNKQEATRYVMKHEGVEESSVDTIYINRKAQNLTV